MNLFSKVIKKLFLVKEIVSKEGAVHFRRYRLLSTPWFNFYVHNLLRSDEDLDMHDHPWNFISLILKGSYIEESRYFPNWGYLYSGDYKRFNLIIHAANDAHKLTLLTPEVWTMVFTWGKKRDWGYRKPDGTWIDHKEYRALKNSNK